MQNSILIAAASLFVGTSLIAVPINITVADGQAGNGATAPWAGTPGLGAGNEDNETEPRTHTGDVWDLEAFVYNPSTSILSLIGTFDFKNGVAGEGVSSGAIFIKPDGSLSWTYAYVLNFNDNTYALYDSFTTLAPTDISASDPWSINTATAHSLSIGAFTYTTGILNPFGLGLQRAGGTGHNEIDLGLGGLPDGVTSDFDVHFTISCGNDAIEGYYSGPSVPDGGATALLMAAGLGGLMFVRRRFR